MASVHKNVLLVEGSEDPPPVPLKKGEARRINF